MLHDSRGPLLHLVQQQLHTPVEGVLPAGLHVAMAQRPHHSDDGQPLPFASTFEGPAPVAVTGNCIVRQSPLQLPTAEAERLSNAGLKLKQSATCVPVSWTAQHQQQ